MTETDWMYDSLTERFGENLGERQKVVDALLIAKAVVGPNALGVRNHEAILSVARFILDEWGKYSDAEDHEESGDPVVLDISTITTADINLMKKGTHMFPEGSRWRNYYGYDMIFTGGEFLFLLDDDRFKAATSPDTLPFARIKEEN